MEAATFQVRRNGTSLEGECLGDGAPLVLLHGLSATRRNVVQGSRHLAKRGYRLIAYDARGHGASTPAQSYGYPELVGDLEAVLDHETDALQHRRPCDLSDTTSRKRQGLLELSRFMPRLAEVAERDMARTRLSALAVKLERNRMALDVQIGAVREVADTIACALRDAESDGTYGAAVMAPSGSQAEAHPQATLQPDKTKTINVPIIVDGALQGYVGMQFSYVVEASAAKAMPVSPAIYLLDAAFSDVYMDKSTDFNHLDRMDLPAFTKRLVGETNARLGAPLVKDVLIESFNYTPKDVQN